MKTKPYSRLILSLILSFFYQLSSSQQDDSQIYYNDSIIWHNDTVNLYNKFGDKQGIWLCFHDNDSIKKSTFHMGGAKNGYEKTYYKSGQLKSYVHHVNDIANGFYMVYFENSNIKETGIWKNGKNIGHLEVFYANGTLKSSSIFSGNGKRNGQQIEYHPNEFISKIYSMNEAIMDGFYIEYDTLGNFNRLLFYEASMYDGKLVSVGNVFLDGDNDMLLPFAKENGLFEGVTEFVNSKNKAITKRKQNQKTQVALKLQKVESIAKIEKQKVELLSEKKIKLFFIVGAIILLIVVIIIWNNLRKNARASKLILFQKEKIEEAHKEITDSIAYAKRIQSAILPPPKLVKQYLKESFILYKPKDVVAGDFYWMENVKDKVIFAAADCTGHGVPGAMVSVVCNNGLNRSVREHGLTIPGEILDKTREIIVKEFQKSEEDIKDGMDIALCSIEGMKLQYAGAYNPLWIIRNGEIIETKANKQPIGQFENPKPYTTHSFDLEQGDAIYIFSDGYVDQFGGERGKKFKSKAFRELLLSIQDKPMEEQKTSIDDTFETWKSDLEQVDDVCVIGVRV